MKKLVIIASLILLPGGLLAQFNIGITAGGGFTQIQAETAGLPCELNSITPAFRAGIFLRYGFSKYYIQLTPSYVNKGTITLSNSTTEWKTPAITKFAFPLRAGIRFISGLRIYMEAGYQFELWSDENIPYELRSELIDDPDINDVSLDIVAYIQPGISMDFNKFNIGVSFQIPFWEEFSIGWEYEYKLPVVGLDLSYRLDF